MLTCGHSPLPLRLQEYYMGLKFQHLCLPGLGVTMPNPLRSSVRTNTLLDRHPQQQLWDRGLLHCHQHGFMLEQLQLLSGSILVHLQLLGLPEYWELWQMFMGLHFRLATIRDFMSGEHLPRCWSHQWHCWHL